MKPAVLLDTGPLVAFLDRKDNYYEWALFQWKQLDFPLISCEPVLVEACFLLGGFAGPVDLLLELITRHIITISFHIEDHVAEINWFLKKYRQVPMSLADACLVRMAELYPQSVVLTLDQDFNIYRKQNKQVIPTIMPQGH